MDQECFETLWYFTFCLAAAESEPEANERGSSLISRRLHYRGLQSLFLTFLLGGYARMEDLGCAVVCARNCGYARMGRFRMRSTSKSRLAKGHEI